MLLASALAQEDEFGFFSAGRRRASALDRITGKEHSAASFAQHLDELAVPTRAGAPEAAACRGSFRYRFVNPLLQPYVVMRGLSEGSVSPKGLR